MKTNTRVILKEKIKKILENEYQRNMSGLLERRRTLTEDILNAPCYPYSIRQRLVHKKHKNIVLEGLTMTYPTKKTISYIKNTLEKKNLPIGEFIENNYYGESDIADSINVIVDGYSLTQELNDTLVKLFDSCGYYQSCFYWSDDKHDGIYQFEPKYQEDAFNATEIGDYLYHITTLNHYNKIIKQGFIPKSKNKKFNYPPRCYFFTECDVEFMIDFMHGSGKAKQNDELILITVDTRKLKDDIKFWIDQLFVGEDIAVYTYDNIPNTAIINVEKL